MNTTKKVLLGLAGLALMNAQTDYGAGIVLSDADAQACFDHFGILSADIEDNEDISNECIPEVVDINGQQTQTYNYEVSYTGTYRHDENCGRQTIHFVNTELNEGGAQFDEFTYDGDVIRYSLLHDDLEPVYGCIKITNDDEYIWQCPMQLTIYFGSNEQLVYSYFQTITLSRVFEDQLTVTVTKNEVVGDCCENELNIETALTFCTSYACDAYLPDGLVIERKADIYVEHSIVTPEFQYYFLHGLQLKLGAFVPNIIAWDGSQAGRIIYHFQSNIAMDNMVLSAISRIDENPANRRQLQNADVGDDYKLKAENQISVTELDSGDDDGNEDNSASIIAPVVLGLVCLLI